MSMYLIVHVVNDEICNLQINAMHCATLCKKMFSLNVINKKASIQNLYMIHYFLYSIYIAVNQMLGKKWNLFEIFKRKQKILTLFSRLILTSVSERKSKLHFLPEHMFLSEMKAKKREGNVFLSHRAI